MIAIITGDIINSEARTAKIWIPILKEYFSQFGDAPQSWEIYRGDEFQLKLAPEIALKAAIQLKAQIKQINQLDVRLGIGLGEETYKGDGVSDSNGSAYQRSGRTFEGLKAKKLNLALASGNSEFDRTFNLMLKLALNFMNDWSRVSAEIIAVVLAQPSASQQQIAEQLNIQQSAVSQRQKRARWELIQDVLTYYSEHIKRLKT